MKRLTAVTDPLLLNAIRREISILQRVSFDRNVVQVRSLCVAAAHTHRLDAANTCCRSQPSTSRCRAAESEVQSSHFDGRDMLGVLPAVLRRMSAGPAERHAHHGAVRGAAATECRKKQ